MIKSNLKAAIVELPCLWCGKLHEFKETSYEANGVFNVFCHNECEDRYAWFECSKEELESRGNEKD